MFSWPCRLAASCPNYSLRSGAGAALGAPLLALGAPLLALDVPLLAVTSSVRRETSETYSWVSGPL